VNVLHKTVLQVGRHITPKLAGCHKLYTLGL